nr:MAG TPA: hypothetical protein [Caudoviricetes sp.]
MPLLRPRLAHVAKRSEVGIRTRPRFERPTRGKRGAI